jgi:hypothetical protein
MNKHTVHVEDLTGLWAYKVFVQNEQVYLSSKFDSLKAAIEHETVNYGPLGTADFVASTSLGIRQIEDVLNPFP